MSKKDYIAFAQMLREEYESATDIAALRAIRDIAARSAAIFERDNPAFSRAQFLAACGM